ncbi:MAG: TfoX/Sxy family protein [Betaproteobacteria bacterium]|nr:TfoX/Sxy family protein [Betaproteobacteria bacterium]
MAHDSALAERIRRTLAGTGAVVEKRMFGGLCFMLDGHMCCGISGEDLVLRVGRERYEEVLRKPHTRPMTFTGRPLTGFVYVSPAGLASTRELKRWVRFAVANVKSLPRRVRKSPSRRNKE